MNPSPSSSLPVKLVRTSGFFGLPPLLFGLVILLGDVPIALGQVARIDPDFHRPDFTQTAYPARVIADGRGGLLWTFFNGGYLDRINGQRVGGVIRTTLDGLPDPTFAAGPVLGQTWATAVQADGKILVAGELTGDRMGLAAPNYRVVRLLQNGSLDASYASPVFDGLPRFITLQPDGRALVDVTSANRTGNGGISTLVRLRANGSVDDSFRAPVLVGASAFLIAPIAVDAAGRLLVGGSFTEVNGQSRTSLARLMPDGTLDVGFRPLGLSTTRASTVRGILLQPNGKVVVAGRLFVGEGTAVYPLFRFNGDGSPDPSFVLVPLTTLGLMPSSYPRVMASLPGGKILTAGGAVLRFHADGMLDATYHAPSLHGFATIYWFASLPDGSLVAPTGGPTDSAGEPFTVDGVSVGSSFRLGPDGQLDPAYAAPAFQMESQPGMSIQPDGRLVVWGRFDQVDGNPRRGIARLTANGELDPLYGAALPADLQSVRAAGRRTDGGLYAILEQGGPDPLGVYGLNTNRIRRLTVDGAVDPGFQPDDAVPPWISGVDPAPDLVVHGDLVWLWRNSVQDAVEGRPFMARLKEDGARDPGFVGLTSPLGRVNRRGQELESVVVGDLALLDAGAHSPPVGTLTVGTYDDPSAGYEYELVRLNADGSVAGGFTGPRAAGGMPTSSFAEVYDEATLQYVQVPVYLPNRSDNPFRDVLALPDGGLLVAGGFSSLGLIPVGGLAKLRPNGELDLGFGTLGAGAMNLLRLWSPARVDSIALDAQGRLWVVGDFDTFNYVACPGIARLKPDGTIDETFQSEVGALLLHDARAAVATTPDGDLVLTGGFRAPKEVWPAMLSRLTLELAPALAGMRLVEGELALEFQNPKPGSALVIESTQDFVQWTPVLTNNAGYAAFSEAVRGSSHRFYRAVVR